MAEAISPAIVAERTKRMRALTDQERAAAIAAAPNVVGLGRFARIVSDVLCDRIPCSDGTDGA